MTSELVNPELLNKLYRYGLALTHDADAAADLLQDTVERALRSSPVSAAARLVYLRTAMRNRFIDNYRRQQRVAFESLDDHSDEPVSIDPRSLEDLVVDQLEVEQLLTVLNPLERETLFLWAVEGYTAAEIAEFSGASRSTVLSRIQRLRLKVVARFPDNNTNRSAEG